MPSRSPLALLAPLAFLAACGGGAVSSDQEAEFAYLGLDRAVGRALDLGLVGFAAAQSANIDPQTGAGDVSGTLSVTGQVDQGNSDNKGLRLDAAFADYADLIDVDDDPDAELAIAYDTADVSPVPHFDLQLKGMPDGTLDGTIAGDVAMAGDLDGLATLDLAVDGPTQDDGSGQAERVPGSTHVTGTVTNGDGGVFDVDVTL